MFRPAVTLLLFFTVLFGFAYPLLVTGIAQIAFPSQAEGSLLRDGEERVVGSAVIGQPFSSPGYLWGRPSATMPAPYNAAASGGSNLSNGSPALLEAVQARIDALRKADPENKQPIPVDLVTASASGLDPHISIAAAHYQLPRIAKARGIATDVLQEIVSRHTTPRFLDIFGEPVVNVLEVNLELDTIQNNEKLGD